MDENQLLNAPDSALSKIDPEADLDPKRVSYKELRGQQNKTAGYARLTDWKNEPTVRQLKQDLENAKPFRDAQVQRVNHWELLREGGKPPVKRRGRSAVRPKLVRRQAEWRYSALSEPFLSSQDIFQVNPRTYEDGPAAAQNALLINWQFRTKMDLVRLVNEAVRTFVDEGTLVLRTGWKREYGLVEVEVPVYDYRQVYEDSEEEEALKQALQLRDTNPDEFRNLDPAIIASVEWSERNGVTAWATQNGTTKRQERRAVKNHPTVEVCDYRNVYIDPSCGNDPEKANFVIISFETSKAELMKDSRYKNLRSVNYANADILSDTEHGTETPQDYNFDDELRKRIVAYEYWGMSDIDGTGELKPIVATWINDQMIRMEANPFPDKKFPFVFQSYSPKKRSVYGEPDAELLEDNQKISGALTRGMIDLLGRSANAQQGIQKGMLDITNRRRFEAGEDYEFNPAANPNQALIEHKYPELPQSALVLLQSQNAEAEGLTGVKSFSGGLSGENYGEVAAGIKGVVDAAAKREMDILRRLAECFKRVAEKIIAMNADFLSEEETVRVTNQEFVQIRRDDLAGQFDLIVDISTPEIDERKAADLAFMLQTTAQSLPFEFTQMILSDIARLRKMPELQQKIDTYEPQPDPIQQAKDQLEVSKLQLENAEIQAEIAKINAQTEKLQAETDKIDVETELNAAGITHARDMEKQSEQARGNQDLAITKALTAPKKEGEGEFDLEAAVGYNELTKDLSKASNSPDRVI